MGMVIDGIAASEHLDSSGEILKVAGHDISDLVEGKGVINWEHNNDSGEDIIGAITFAKKIMKKSDCSNAREREYWDKCGTPFVYIKAELFEDEQHPGAIAAAAIIRYYHKRELKILAGFSIEGTTLERDENILERTVGRRVACTLRPCNKSAISGVLEDELGDDIKKFMDDTISSKIKTVDVGAMVFDDIAKSDADPLEELKKAVSTLKKTLTAGNYDVAPSNLTGGSALQVEHRVTPRSRVGLPKEMKEKLKRAVSDWDQETPLRDVVKGILPELSDHYVDHFTELAEDMSLKKEVEKKLKKSSENPYLTVRPHHSWNRNMDSNQRALMSGLVFDKNDIANARATGQRKVPATDMNGKPVHVMYPPEGANPESSSDYYNLASGYFGMGDHVLTANHFDHYRFGDDKRMTVQEHPGNTHTPFDEGSWGKTLESSKTDGSLHKLSMMDLILDAPRHMGNTIGREGRVTSMDNDMAMSYNGKPKQRPYYFFDSASSEGGVTPGIAKELPHVSAVQWVASLDPRRLAEDMMNIGVEKPKIKEAVRRLKVLQQHSGTGADMDALWKLINSKGRVK